MNQRRQLTARACGAALLFTCVGCTTYVGHKLPDDGSLPAGSTGIPFMMTRPEYSVDVTPDPSDATKAVYTLSETDVPDATQRYSVRLDPALLVDGTFDFTFGDNGNLTTSTTTTTSRVVATLQAAIGAVIDVAGKGVAKDEGHALGSYIFLVKNTQERACIKVLVPRKTTTDKDITVESTIFDRLVSLREQAGQEVAEADENKRASAVAKLVQSRFYYDTADEAGCLKSLAIEATAKSKTEVEDKQKAYEVELAKPPVVAARAPAASASSAIVLAATKKGVADATTSSANDLKELKAEPDLDPLKNAAIDLINTKIADAERQAIATRFAKITPEQSRARMLQDIESQIARRQFDLTVATRRLAALEVDRNADKSGKKKLGEDIGELESQLRSLRAAWGATLQAKAQIQRVAMLDSFLTEVHVTRADGGGQRYAIDEMVKARTERDALQGQIDALRSTLVALADPPNAKPDDPKIVPRMAQRVRLVTAATCNPAAFKDQPEFVVVLSKQAGAMTVPDPVLVPPCDKEAPK